jgi:hypothetical protein
MTLEERVTRLEYRIDQLDGVTDRLERIEVILTRMLATLDNHDRTLREIASTLPTLGFRWPWESRP